MFKRIRRWLHIGSNLLARVAACERLLSGQLEDMRCLTEQIRRVCHHEELQVSTAIGPDGRMTGLRVTCKQCDQERLFGEKEKWAYVDGDWRMAPNWEDMPDFIRAKVKKLGLKLPLVEAAEKKE